MAAEPNNLVREMVRILPLDNNDVPVHGAAMFLAASGPGPIAGSGPDGTAAPEQVFVHACDGRVLTGTEVR